MNKVLALLAALFFAGHAFAQSSVSAPTPTDLKYGYGGASEGFRLTFLKPSFDIKLKQENSVNRRTDKADMDDTFGLAFGYASLPVGSIGFTGDLAYLVGEVDSEDYNFLRAAGNVAFAANQYVYMFGGLNLSYITKAPGDLKKAVDTPFFGYQVGVGTQFTSNFGLDLKYISMNQTGEENSVDLDLEQKGLELGLHATF